MSPTPEISLVIAAYNAAETIGAELDALAEQTFEGAWEVLVCDNGSTDETAAVAASYADSLPVLRVVDASAVRGPGAARNAGAAAASAPLLAFCDADDVVASDWLAVMRSALEEATLVTGRPRRLEFNSRPEDPQYFTWGIYRVPFFPYLPGAGAGNMGVHRDAFLSVGGFDESLHTGEDLDLCWRLQLAGHQLVEEPAAVVTVSNREGLRATIAQTYAYGVGDRRLKHKYALVEEAFLRQASRTEAAPGASDGSPGSSASGSWAPGPSAPPLAARIWRKVTTTRRLSDLTNLTRRVSTWVGFRFGRIDRTVPQVIPPARLPDTTRPDTTGPDSTSPDSEPT